jgi:hypothetical protein
MAKNALWAKRKNALWAKRKNAQRAIFSFLFMIL